MRYEITAPQRLNATLRLPASKSISNRALIINALAKGEPRPDNLSDCDDTQVIVDALDHAGDTIDIHNGGTSMRFLTAYLAVTPGEYVLTGTERMKQRPIGILVDALRYLGADIEYLGAEGYPPLRIRGRRLGGGHVEIKGDVSSQFTSALLMVAPMLTGRLEVRMTGNLVSKPYIDLTLWMMREYGAEADWTDADTITVEPVPYMRRQYTIESDWSASSYWYEMLALADDRESVVRFTGLRDGSMQGDSGVRYIFSLLGVKTHFDTAPDGLATVTLRKQPCLLPRLDYDFLGSPDLAQTVVVSCALMGIPFRFTGLASLRIKETDRIEALRRELRKLGYVLRSDGEGTLAWDGEQCDPTPGPIATYKDHRMAMAFAPVAMKMPAVQIDDPAVVGKSYPTFWDDLRAAQFQIKEIADE